MKEKIKKNLIQEFESRIKEHEDVLFGMNLYCQGIGFLYKSNKEIVNLNRMHYRNIERRMTTAISKAKQLLEKAKQFSGESSLLQQFEFPTIKGHAMLDEGTTRAKALVKAYEEIFPNRPKTKPLTEKESQCLTAVALEKWD